MRAPGLLYAGGFELQLDPVFEDHRPLQQEAQQTVAFPRTQVRLEFAVQKRQRLVRRKSGGRGGVRNDFRRPEHRGDLHEHDVLDVGGGYSVHRADRLGAAGILAAHVVEELALPFLP